MLFRSLNMAGTFVEVIKTSDNANAQMFVNNTMSFTSPSLITLQEFNGRIPNLVIQNSSVNAIDGYGADKFIRTMRTLLADGYLIRKISNTSDLDYVYPIGSNDNLVDNYAPAIFKTQSGGSSSNQYIGVSTSPGNFKNQFPDGHSFLSGVAVNYIKRFWSVDKYTTDVPGYFTFQYLNSDIVNDENEFAKIGRWTNPHEQSGSWNPTEIAIVNTNFFPATNLFLSGIGTENALKGDWTIGDNQAFQRIFYSKTSGIWNNGNNWTYTPFPHTGVEPPTAPVYPGEGAFGYQDSVVIGGGDNGVGNHIITLDASPTISGILLGEDLGAGSYRSGTLMCGTNILNASYFTMNEYSKLGIGSPVGISTLGSATGNIQSTVTRSFSTGGIYEYNGSANQIYGTGIPGTVRSLIVNNSGAAGSNTLTSGKDLSITDDVSISDGNLDLIGYTINNNDGTGTFSIAADSYIRTNKSGSSGVDTVKLTGIINNYSTYTIDVNSTFEFYGDYQNISVVPTNMYPGQGYGNVLLSTASTNKYVTQPILIRGNLTNSSNVSLYVVDCIDAIMVRKSVFNSGLINNNGVIEIGE